MPVSASVAVTSTLTGPRFQPLAGAGATTEVTVGTPPSMRIVVVTGGAGVAGGVDARSR